jgi:hypothetical protein
MQLLHRKKSQNEETLSPSIYAALVDSMCQNSFAMLFGAICAAAAALMTALKTGYAPIWPCAAIPTISGWRDCWCCSFSG